MSELLVVMGSCALLFSIFLPSLFSLRSRAQTVSCMSNLKQIGVALGHYAADYENYFPSAAPADVKLLSCAQFLLNPYCGGEANATERYFNPFCDKQRSPKMTYGGSKAFYCPSRNNVSAPARYMDYGGRDYLTSPFKLSYLKRPAESVFLVDSCYSDNPSDKNFNIGRAVIGNLKHVHYRHNGVTNSLYLDGSGNMFNEDATIGCKLQDIFFLR